VAEAGGSIFGDPALAPFTSSPQQIVARKVGNFRGTAFAGLPAMSTESRLRHLESAKVGTPIGNLDHIPVLSLTEGSLGQLEGVIIDPNARHVRYYVVESPGWLKTRRYLVPDMPFRLDPDRKALHVDLEADDLSQLPEFDDDEFPAFTDDDFVTALFARR
jgi:hypothetical protein